MSQSIVLVAVLGLAAMVAASHHEGHEIQKEWTGKPWLGTWVSTNRTENWDQFVLALGPSAARHDSNIHKVTHTFYKQGDHYHHSIDVKETGYKQEVDFKLGQEGKTMQNGTEATFKYTEDGETLKGVVTIPSKNRVIEDTYTVKQDELEVTYKKDNVLAKRWFKKQAQTTAH